jgi:16S rRNA (uracil1498-N3)-methyltransferase
VFIADQAGLLAGDRVVLDGDEGRHAAVVRRIRVGERVELTDGSGHLASCVVAEVRRDGLVCDVVARRDVDLPQPRVVVVQALPKGDRGETAVETLTEVGVDEIVPWVSARSVTRWKGERGDKALRRWRTTAREAAKQSRRAWLPLVSPPVSTDDVVALIEAAALGVVLHEEASTPIGVVGPPAAGTLVVVVGPEGGLSPEEADRFGSAGAVSVRLGPTVLRTSTAGTVAAGILQARSVRWR